MWHLSHTDKSDSRPTADRQQKKRKWYIMYMAQNRSIRSRSEVSVTEVWHHSHTDKAWCRLTTDPTKIIHFVFGQNLVNLESVWSWCDWGMTPQPHRQDRHQTDKRPINELHRLEWPRIHRCLYWSRFGVRLGCAWGLTLSLPYHTEQIDSCLVLQRWTNNVVVVS